VGVNLQVWHNVVAMVADVHLTNQKDRLLVVTSEWFVLS
jgi:hypothetical protein